MSVNANWWQHCHYEKRPLKSNNRLKSFKFLSYHTYISTVLPCNCNISLFSSIPAIVLTIIVSRLVVFSLPGGFFVWRGGWCSVGRFAPGSFWSHFRRQPGIRMGCEKSSSHGRGGDGWRYRAAGPVHGPWISRCHGEQSSCLEKQRQKMDSRK